MGTLRLYFTVGVVAAGHYPPGSRAIIESLDDRSIAKLVILSVTAVIGAVLVSLCYFFRNRSISRVVTSFIGMLAGSALGLLLCLTFGPQNVYFPPRADEALAIGAFVGGLVSYVVVRSPGKWRVVRAAVLASIFTATVSGLAWLIL